MKYNEFNLIKSRYQSVFSKYSFIIIQDFHHDKLHAHVGIEKQNCANEVSLHIIWSAQIYQNLKYYFKMDAFM